MGKKIKIHHVGIFVIITALVLLLTIFLRNTVSGEMELLAQNFFYGIRGPLSPGNDVVIAAIDEKSIDELGRWPWPRNRIAELLDRLHEYKAGVVGLDIVFSSPELGTNNDLLLHDAVARSSNTVLGYFFHFSREGLEHLQEKELAGFLRTISRSRYSGIRKTADVSLSAIPLRQAYAVEATIDKIAVASKNAGYFNFHPELDGSIRKVPLLVKYRDMVDLADDDDYLFPPLSLTMLGKYLNSPILVWIDQLGVDKITVAGENNLEIPTNDLGEMWINYYGPEHTFPHYSIVDILARKVSPEDLAGKIVLVGSTAIALADFRPTPFDPSFPGVEIHATIMDNFLHNRILTDPPVSNYLLDVAGVLGFGFLLLLVMPLVGALTGCSIVVSLLVLLLGSGYYLFSRQLMVIHIVPSFSEIVFCSSALYISRFFKEEREKRYIRNAFGKYMSPVVIDQLIQDPSQLMLGGVRREITAFFSDVADFSSISERMPPDELVELLNEYLAEMTDIVLKYEGILDKYEGDAIMGFFGAPIADPTHAEKCCQMALDMQKRLAALRTQWKKQGKPQLLARIGINTGQMVVGNMGSKVRMDYTIMGDAVNLASRLEGVNKEYGTEIIISQYTYEACRDLFEVRELDSVRVIGKKEVIVIYELLCRKGGLSPEKYAILNLYARGLAHYKNCQWDEAIAVFGEIFDTDPDDGPSLTYLERCLDYKINDPGCDWDGIHIMQFK